ncbi:MAG: hypothetical protein PHU06_02585 [Gallionella sp.]|nr:hypothetical protein [Gallionella sp.]MDD4958294.1 hypothetical protein [Gallionella sp.]
MELKNQLKGVMLTAALAATLTACGGGGGVINGVTPMTSPGSPSRVSAGHVGGSRIYLDIDDDHRHSNADIQCGTTAADGTYICYYPNGLTEATNTHMLISVGGVDSYTGLTMNAPLFSPAGGIQISPLTTLAMLQAMSGLPAGTVVSSASFVQANSRVVSSFRLTTGTRLDRTDSLAPGNEPVLAAETAVQSLVEESVATAANAMGTSTTLLTASYNAAMNTLATNISATGGAVMNFATTGVGTIVNSVLTAAVSVLPPVGATTLSANNVVNVVNIAETGVASSVAPTLTQTTAIGIQASASNSVQNIVAINQTLNVVRQTINNFNAPVYNNNQVTQINRVYNVIYQGGYTANNITNINNVVNQLTTVGITNITLVVAPAATFPSTWVFNGLSVAGNGSAPVAASGVGAVTSVLGGSYNIPAGAVGAPVGLQSAVMTLIPNSGMITLMQNSVNPLQYLASIGVSVNSTNIADGRRIQAVIHNIPVTVDATGMHITSLAGATLSAFGNNSRNASFNVTMQNLPATLLTTALNNATGLPNSTDVTLDIAALFSTLAGVGGNTGFANLTGIKGSFNVSMAVSLLDATNPTYPVVPLAVSNLAGFQNTGTQYLSNNIVAVTGSLAQVLGQGKSVIVTLN